jgi:hypothetical protein
MHERIGIRGKIGANRIIVVLFLLSTAFFIIQHYVNVSWDFAAYVDNAKYWTGQGQIYEHVRAPLMPFILMILSIFTWPLAEYVFIVLVSALFCYSSVRLAKTLGFDERIFYFFLLTPFTLLLSMINGSELLSLAVFELFIVFILEKKPYAGLMLGLAFLTRYNLVVFLPLLFIGNVKNVAKNVIAFAIPILAWMYFNLITTGNMFTAFSDTYAIIFKFRDAFQPVNWFHIAYVLLFLTPLFVAGIYFSARRIRLSIRSFASNKIPLLFIFILLMSLYQYVVNPTKDIRYIFLVVLPVAYFSVLAFPKRKKIRILILKILAILTIIFVAALLSTPGYYDPKEKYFDAVDYMKTHNLTHCLSASNSWTIMNYLGKTTDYPPREDMVNKYIDEGYLLVVFSNVQEPLWARNATFLKKLPAIYESGGFSIIGKNCMPETGINSTYVERLRDIVLFQKNVSINTNPCFILFSETILEKACNFLNFRGFMADGNRNDAASLDEYATQQA